MKEKIGRLIITGKDGQKIVAVTNLDKAEALNTFKSVAYLLKNQMEYLMNCHVQRQVKKKLGRLNVTKSSGPDKIHLRILYELKDQLVYPLAKLFNFSIANKQLPRAWLRANITAIYKKGKKDEVSMYRPINLTCVVCKLMVSFI